LSGEEEPLALLATAPAPPLLSEGTAEPGRTAEVGRELEGDVACEDKAGGGFATTCSEYSREVI
jgi:hypothetical protein